MTGAVAASTLGGFSRLAALTIGNAASSADPGGPVTDLTLTFKTDGTWAFTVGAGDTLTATPSSATWLPAGASAADYEMKYTVTAGPAPAGIATVTNGASAYSAVTVDRSILLSLTDPGPTTDTITVVVDLRHKVRTGDAVTDTLDMTTQAT